MFTLFVIFVSFSTYFCMYAFRKPFSAVSYQGLKFLGGEVDLKTAFVVSQIIGYVLSKIIGIKVCPEIGRQRRAQGLVLMILLAELSLLFFAILPNNLKVVAIFFNGLPLGMVWGLVVLYLEGRRTSEMLRQRGRQGHRSLVDVELPGRSVLDALCHGTLLPAPLPGIGLAPQPTAATRRG